MRKVRLDRGLLQREVATELGVQLENVFNWETNLRKPMVRWYPTIMNWLGYCPIQFAESVGQLIRLHRTHRGLTIKKMAEIIGVDQSTIADWELGRNSPFRQIRSIYKVKKIEQLEF